MQKSTFILSDQPLPTARERQETYLRYSVAFLFSLPVENVSVVYADDQEAITVHAVCTCADRHMLTMTHWCSSDDDAYYFFTNRGSLLILDFEPQAGEL